jgi:CRP/FNR family cyclic AMP-dependent transcriptional regulator
LTPNKQQYFNSKGANVLERISLFSDLSKQDIAELEAAGIEQSVPKNTMVISEGDDTDRLYILLKGKAHALRSDETGRQFIVNRFGPYDYFGEMSFFDRNARCATVVTKEKCTLIVLPRQAFFELAVKHPEIYLNVIRALLNKLRRATQQIEELAFLDVYGRLARFFVENQDIDGVIEERLTQQELADMVGSSRETVNRIFNELVAGGYIAKGQGRITVLKKLPYRF